MLAIRLRYKSPRRASAEPVLFVWPKTGNFLNIQPKWWWESSNLLGENVNRSLAILGIASLACAGALFAQSNTPKSGSSKKPTAAAAKDPATVKRGHDIFQEKCSVCHFDTSEAK